MSTLSIIIPVYNGGRIIARCLDSIFDTLPKGVDVIVVDDGSTDDTAPIVKNYPCRLLQNECNRGPASARNRGLNATTADVVLFTDADCVVPAHWASTALAVFTKIRERDPLVAALEGRILPGPGFFRWCDAFAAYGYNQTGPPRYQAHFCTSNIIADRPALKELGYFDESFRVHEDRDLGCRLLGKGLRIYFHPDLFVTHWHGRTTMRSFLLHEFNWGRTAGNDFAEKSLPFQLKWLAPFLKNRISYVLTAPLVATAIAVMIALKNVRYNFYVVIYFPFIFLSKLAYRFGACLSLWGLPSRRPG